MSEAKQPLVEEKQQSEARPKINKVRRRRKIKKILKIVLWVLVLAAIAGGVYWYWQKSQADTAEGGVTYQQFRAAQGSLDKYIYGTGAIAAASQPTVYSEASGTLRELRAEVGDAVRAGQILATLENSALDEEIRQLEYDLWSLDSEITSTSAGTDVTNIKAPVAGRVVKLYAGAGDDSLAVYRDQGSVAIISMDGRMRVEFAVHEDAALTLGDAVTVAGEGFTAEGTVTDLYMQGTRATVTVMDDTLPMDSHVQVATADGAALGEGTLVINKPMSVSAFGGTIQEVRVAEGEAVSRTQTLFTLNDSPNTLKMEDLRLQREAALESLNDAKATRENLIVRAPVDGVVASVSASEGDEVESGAALLSILEGEDMVLTIAVDELDVVSVSEGQAVNITVDALPDLSLTGEVGRVAPVGSGEGGVTTYDVRLNFDAAGTGVRPGMNASGEVQVAHVEDALYVPAEALMTINNETYVLVADSGDGDGTAAVQQQAPAAPEADGAAPEGTDSQSAPAGMSQGGEGMPDFSDMSDEQRQQMRAAREGSGTQAGPRTQMTPTQGAAAQTGTLRAVTTGIANDDYVQILSGLSAGETVLYQNTSSTSSGGNQMMMPAGGGMTTIRMF